MKFETIERCGRVYVIKNGVESAAFVLLDSCRAPTLFKPEYWGEYRLLDEALALIADAMDTWYTIAQAAERLAELGAYDSPPSAYTMSNLARAGAFAGAFKLRGLRSGRGGQGGAWRIPEAGIIKFVKRREGQ